MKVDYYRTLKLNFNCHLIFAPLYVGSYVLEGIYRLTDQKSKTEGVRSWREKASGIKLSELAFMSKSDILQARKPKIDIDATKVKVMPLICLSGELYSE